MTGELRPGGDPERSIDEALSRLTPDEVRDAIEVAESKPRPSIEALAQAASENPRAIATPGLILSRALEITHPDQAA